MSNKRDAGLPTLRRRLTASLVLVSALPLIIIGLLANYVLMDIDRQEVMEKNLLIATAFSGEVERFLALEREALEELLLHIHEERFFPEHRQIYLLSFLKANEAFQRVLVLSERGTVSSTVPQSRDYVGLDLSESEGFRSTRSAGSSHLSEVAISLETGEPVAVMTVSGTRMTVMGYIDLAALKALNDRIRLGRTGYGIIVDRTGVIIAHRDWQLVQQQGNFSRYGFFEAFRRKGGGTFLVQDGGDEEIMSGVLMPDPGWGVIVSQRTDEAFAYSRRFLAILFSGLLVSVGMAVVISFITLRRVLVPLASLGERTRQVAEGYYHLPQATGAAPAYQEIADLSHDFQSMIEAVLERQQRLSDSEEKYRTLFEESRDGILIATYEGVIVDTNRAFVEMAGFDSRDELVGSNVIRLYDEPGQRTAVLEQLAREGYITAYEIRLKRRDGSTGHAVLSSTAVRDASGAIVGTRSIVRDVTEHRSLEAQLRQSQKMEAVGILPVALPMTSIIFSPRSSGTGIS